MELINTAPSGNAWLSLGPRAPRSIRFLPPRRPCPRSPGAAPDPIVYGTALGSGQLDATANVPGTFSYTPAAGTILGLGSHTLSVTFTPSDTLDYTTATATTTITVEPATPTVGSATPVLSLPRSKRVAPATTPTTRRAGRGPTPAPPVWPATTADSPEATLMPRSGPRSPSCRTRARSARSWSAWRRQLRSSFDAAQRGDSQASQQDFQVLVDGSVIGTFTPTETSYTLYTTATFTVTAGGTRSPSRVSTRPVATTPP